MIDFDLRGQVWQLSPDLPALRVSSRVVGACGCAALVGIRMDIGELAIIWQECDEHTGSLASPRERFAATLDDPRDDAVDVVIEECMA